MSQHDIPKVYNPHEAEAHWYPLWESRGYFKPEVHPNGEPYCIVIPPPNVTGYLHMGHALQHTLMDILTRWRRMQGRKALWLPGTDHAGISTQVVVERQLAAEGLTREALGREEFEKRVWQWKEHSGGTIQRQMRLEGASVDWSRERFTLDPGLSQAVREAFVRLYEEGLIYRGSYIVNWCPRCLTALSDLEAPKQEVHGKLYYIAYPIKGSGIRDQGSGTTDHVVVATTRPETMLGDTAVAINPEDERYHHLRGATVILPIMDRELPVIETESVEKGFGTGVVKVTPAHDPADYEIGRQYNLPSIVVIDKYGRMTAEARRFAGLDRFEARRQILEELEKSGLLVKVEDYTHSIGHCDRCHTIIEPLVSMQWFLNVKAMAEEAIQAVKDGRTRFVPSNWEKVYFDWLENIRDWCISRQLWWGHRIPAWYCPDGHITVARETPDACTVCGSTELTQDEDVLDTWFSSALWPFSTLGWPDDTEDLRTFYPTDVLVTGFDIIFFWVARMMMMGLKFMKDHPSRQHAVDPDAVPFHTVFITGLIRDPYGQKMSKMKGNVIDPLEVFKQYGTDAARFTLAAAASPGTDIALQYSKMEGYRNFCNKIWNAARFVLMNCSGTAWNDKAFDSDDLPVYDRWIILKLTGTVEEVKQALEEFRFHQAADTLYHFFWDDFCDWYIEFSKPLVVAKESTNETRGARERLVYILEQSLRLLHPFMPFITEEIWQRLAHPEGDSICLAAFPCPSQFQRFRDKQSSQYPDWLYAYGDMGILTDLIRAIRERKALYEMPPAEKVPLEIYIPGYEDEATRRSIEQNLDHIYRQAGVRDVKFVESPADFSRGARGVVTAVEFAIPLEEENLEKVRSRLRRELKTAMTEFEKHEQRYISPDFREKAPTNIVVKTKAMLQKYGADIERIQRALEQLK